MRKLFNWLALGAAIIIVAYSASTLFNSAFHSMTQEWQQWQTAVGAAAVVLWEATALLLIGWCWHHGYKPVAALAVPLLILACIVSLHWESQLLVVGQSDKVAERVAQIDNHEGVKRDLKWYRDRRDVIKTSRSSSGFNRELELIEKRIRELEGDRWHANVVDASPQAAWISRLTGMSEQLSRDVSILIILLFWMMARVIAVPLAIAGLIVRMPEKVTAKILSDRPDLARLKPVESPAITNTTNEKHSMPTSTDLSNVTMLEANDKFKKKK